MFRRYRREFICIMLGFMLALIILGYHYSNSLSQLENLKSGLYVVLKKKSIDSIPSKLLIKKSRCYISLKQEDIAESKENYLVKIPLDKMPSNMLAQVFKSKIKYLTNVNKRVRECHASHFVFYSY